MKKTTAPSTQKRDNTPSLDNSTLTRRRFLQAAALTAAAIACPPFISRSLAANAAKSPYRNIVSPSKRVRVACVGIGGRGYSDLAGLVDAGAELVALCDVDFARAHRAFCEYPLLPRYRDYRQMLDEMDGGIDAVMIATPDHMHFPIALMAIERGKHVYVEKPLTHTIGEARILKAAARKHGVVTQMGNQGHANEGTRFTKEWIDAGVIGTVREVHCWTNRPVWPQNIPWPAVDPKAKMPPETLDWNLWLGVAPKREYLPDLVPFNWRGFWDYGCGALGDMGCHIMDAAFWTLNLSGPCKVNATKIDGGSLVCGPKASVIEYNFPARGSLPPVKFTWYDGGLMPSAPAELGTDEKLSKGGTLYYGDKGIMYSNNDYNATVRLLPESRMKEFTSRPPKTIPRIPKANQYREWLDGCQGQCIPGSNIADYSADLTEFVSLGNVALRARKPIDWDAKAGTCAGMPELTPLIQKNYRVY